MAALFTTPHTSAQEVAASRVFAEPRSRRSIAYGSTAAICCSKPYGIRSAGTTSRTVWCLPRLALFPRAEDEFITVKGPMEILNINGLIAAGEPHLHLTLSADKGAFGGHLENGCRVLYRAEITIAKFSGRPWRASRTKTGFPCFNPSRLHVVSVQLTCETAESYRPTAAVSRSRHSSLPRAGTPEMGMSLYGVRRSACFHPA